MTDVAYIALGSNMGDRDAHLVAARSRIAATPGLHVLAASDVEETEPVGVPEQPPFLNQMIAVATALSPRALLGALHAIEQAGGRVRGRRWGPRTIDLDIVAFERATVSDADLVVPHAELGNRPFWQRELASVRARVRGSADVSASGASPR